MDNKKMITVGSMFAGIGGIELAFEQVGCKTIWANEKDKYACKTSANCFTFICVFIVLYIFVNTLFLPYLLHFLILLAQSLQVFQYKRIRLVVYLVFGERGVFLHGGDGGGVYLKWGGGLLLAVEFLHLEHMRVAA